MLATSKQVGNYVVSFDPEANAVFVAHLGSESSPVAKLDFPNGEQAYTQYVRLSMEETILNFCDKNPIQ